MQIPDKLKARLEKLGLGESIYDQRTRKCILSKKPLDLERVPWYGHAYFIDDKVDTLKRVTQHGSDEFIFDPVSLVPCLALEPKNQDKILDMCAAPGTKTFILSFLTENDAHVTANDISEQRVRRLKSVVNKYGLSVEVLNKSGRKLEGKFDKILLDAPCSGEGMVNKKKKLFDNWSEKKVKLLAKKQKKLIQHAFDMLTEGGTLVYSTCTFEPEENEAVVDHLLSKNDDARIVDIEVKINHLQGLTNWTDKKYHDSLKKCVRIYPQHNMTGGFFVAKITKS